MKLNRKKIAVILLFIILAASGGGYYYLQQELKAKQAETAAQILADERFLAEKRRQAAVKALAEASRPTLPPTPPVEPAFNKSLFSVDDPASSWVVVNKLRPLNPKEYIPTDLVTPKVPLRLTNGAAEMKLRQEAATALETMFAAAKLDNANLMIASAYRSYNTQVAVYNNEVSRYGQAVADSQSARPGFSEHQTGWGVDLEPTSRQCEIEDCFADTTEGKWLKANATKYGFIQRYTPDKPAITGYRAESWHYRYVGVSLAAELTKLQIQTLEEFFDLPAAPDYQ